MEQNKEALLDSMEQSFAQSSGMTCTSSIEVEDAGFVIDININEFDNIDDATKKTMQEAYDALGGTFDGMLSDLQKEIPELEYFSINVCEKDGDLLASIKAGE